MAQGSTYSVSPPVMKMGGARVYRSTTQTLTNITTTAVIYDAVMYDDAGYWSQSSPDSLIIPPGLGGRYTISGWVYITSNPTGIRIVAIELNGVLHASQRISALPANTDGLNVSMTVDLNPGDVIKLMVYQSSGGDLDISVTSTPANLTLQRVGLASGSSPTGLATQSALTCNDNVLLGRLTQGSLGTIKEIPFSEGTFTPTFTFATPGNLSVSYTTQIGRYIRIGPMVWCYLELNFTPTHTSASGAARVAGLPFTVGSGFASTTGTFDLVTSPAFTFPTGTTMITCRAITNSTEMDFLATGSGATRANLLTTQFPTATARRFICNLTYYTDNF